MRESIRGLVAFIVGMCGGFAQAQDGEAVQAWADKQCVAVAQAKRPHLVASLGDKRFARFEWQNIHCHGHPGRSRDGAVTVSFDYVFATSRSDVVPTVKQAETLRADVPLRTGAYRVWFRQGEDQRWAFVGYQEAYSLPELFSVAGVFKDYRPDDLLKMAGLQGYVELLALSGLTRIGLSSDCHVTDGRDPACKPVQLPER